MKTIMWCGQIVQTVCCTMLLLGLQVADAATRPGRAAVCGLKGTAEYQVRGRVTWQQLRVGMVLGDGILIRTYKGSSADLAFTTGAIARIAEKTLVSIDKLTEEVDGLPQPGKRPVGHTEMTVQRGKLMAEVAKQTLGSQFRMHTPMGSIDVKGTQLIITYDPTTGQFTLSVPEGSVTLTLPGGQTVTVTQGNQISGVCNPVTGQVTVSQSTPVPMDPYFRAFLSEITNSGVREWVINSTGPIDLESLLRDAIAAAGGTGSPVMVNINNPVAVSPSSP